MKPRNRSLDWTCLGILSKCDTFCWVWQVKRDWDDIWWFCLHLFFPIWLRVTHLPKCLFSVVVHIMWYDSTCRYTLDTSNKQLCKQDQRAKKSEWMWVKEGKKKRAKEREKNKCFIGADGMEMPAFFLSWFCTAAKDWMFDCTTFFISSFFHF